MSLFKTRTFWCTKGENEEQFDQNCLTISKLNTSSDFILTGSQNGIIRIFKPSSDLNEAQEFSGYKPTDLLIEKDLIQPILQVDCGRLISGSTQVQIAILQPKSFSVWCLLSKPGATDHGIQHNLSLLYEHKQRRASFYFVLGQFGRVLNRDFTCVQSLDGQLAFYEQETFSFSCMLPDFLLPSPLAYSQKTDSFLTCNSDWFILNFKYSSLHDGGDKPGGGAGREIAPNWKFNLGEGVIDIEVVDNDHAMILGEKNLFCLGCQGGRLVYMKKLDFLPICFTNYVLGDKIISLVVSETSTLLIYQGTSVKWSARLEVLPVSIKRAFLHNISGVLVLLSEPGDLECCYLGTEPNLFIAPPMKAPELDFDSASLELATLHRIIRNSYTNEIKVTNTSAQRELAINVAISPHIETDEEDLKYCKIALEVVPQVVFEEVQVVIYANSPLQIEPRVQFYKNLTEKTVFQCKCRLESSGLVCASLQLKILASFVSSLGVPRTLIKTHTLPMALVLEGCEPKKESEHKITLNINQSPASLSHLFPEFSGQYLTVSSNAVGFLDNAGNVVTVMLAKSGEKYRIQSDSFTALSLVIEEIIERSRRNNTELSYNSSFPINEVLNCIRNHFEARQKCNKLLAEISQLNAQFRLIQKRLIGKFKAKNPTPLSNMQLLLRDTFQDIMSASDQLEKEEHILTDAKNELACALQLVTNLLKVSKIDERLVHLLEPTFSPHINNLENQGWEDVADASTSYLLRTCLAKSEKDHLRAAHTSFDEIKDLTKLEKHFSQVLERLPKTTVSQAHFPTNEEDNKRDESEEVPMGSQIAESSSRLLSARKGLLKRRLKIDE